MNAGSSSAHSKLKQDIRLALGREPDIVLWPLCQGRAEARPGIVRFFGLVPGAADLIGLGPKGVFWAIECKTGGADLTPEQRAWGAIIERLGGVYAVVRSVDDAREALTRARERG